MHVRLLLYKAMQHSFLLRTLLVLAAMVAVAIALGVPEAALAGGLDGFDP